MAIDFIGIGAQHAGTTWLYEMLNAHPGIEFPAGKEVKFWSQGGRYVSQKKGDQLHFSFHPSQSRNADEWTDLFPESSSIQGEITQAYAILPPQTIQTIYNCAPELKVIFILRNPAERAWSDVKVFARTNQLEEVPLKDIHNRVLYTPNCLLRSHYSITLEQWLSVFPENQFKILNYEDIKVNPVSLLKSTAEFLGADPEFFDELPEQQYKRKVNQTLDRSLEPDMEARTLLKSLFRGEISNLEKRLNKDLSHWDSFFDGTN